jgi:hypothetical protein
MSNIVLISAYCNTEEKLNVLRKNLKIIKSKGIDTAVISPIPLPEDITKLSDYTFITKENPVLDWPERAIAMWKTISTPKGFVKLVTTTPDYGFAGLNHVKRLGEIFINYDYQYFTFIIYDIIITPQVLKVLEEGHDSIVYPSKFKDSHIIFDVSLHLLSLNKENLKKVINKIDFKEYKKSRTEWDVEAYLQYKIINPLNINIGDFVVEDEIFFYEDLFNHSNSPLLDYFIHTPDENHINSEIDYNLGIIFYNLESSLHLNFDINNKINKFKIENGNFVDLGIKKSSVESISFKYKDQIFDLTEQILKLKHTRIIINV